MFDVWYNIKQNIIKKIGDKGMKINVVGLGYIGLPTSLILSSSGNKIVGSDVNEELINTLKSGVVTFEEEGLQDLFERALGNNIGFDTEYVEADMYIITVPTPYDKESKKINPVYIVKALEGVLNVCKDGSIIVIESTVSPGTIGKYVRPVVANSLKQVEIVHAPERILPGAMISELVNNPRTIGADNIEIAKKVKEVYSTFCKGKIVLTDIETAEMSKVVENTFRDINIAFANELALICAKAGLDVYEVIRIANSHPRVNILSPGPGVGGHCISVDPWFLVGDYPELTNLILQARTTNDNMPSYVYNLIVETMKNHNIVNFSEVGIYGLTYKENVDDMRESPTTQLLDLKLEGLDQVKLYDPFISNKIFEKQSVKFSEFLKDLKLVVVLVSHNHIIENQELLSDIITIDTKNKLEKLTNRITL